LLKTILKLVTWPAIAGLLAALLILQRLDAPGTLLNGHGAPPSSYADAVRVAAPYVVNIYTSKVVKSRKNPWLEDPYFRNFFPRERRQRDRIQRSLGSGVIMSREGHILTNAHVIAGADEILVLLYDGREALARPVGSDPETDLAVLRIDLPDVDPALLADSDRVRVGDVVLAIGNPLGYGHSVSQGIVSALGRYGLQANTYEDYIQTDAAINPGNSGGALINTRGELLGINTLIGSVGIGLAIPSNLALFVMNDLIQYGEVIRGWLGVSVQPLRAADELSNQQALAVIAVGSGSPARKAGIQPGDIITHIDGEPVADGRVTMHRIALLRPGDSITVTLLRGAETLEILTMVGARPTPDAG
jgi:serine protease DegS